MATETAAPPKPPFPLTVAGIATRHPTWPAHVCRAAKLYYAHPDLAFPWLVAAVGERWATTVSSYR